MADELDSGLAAVAALLAGCPSRAFTTRLREELEGRIRMASGMGTLTTASRGARQGFTTVTPFVMAPDVEPVIALATQVFGAVETLRGPGGGGGIHVELRIGDSMLMCGGGAGSTSPVIPPRQMGFHLYVDDCDAVYEKAVAAGAVSLGAPADRPYGERSGFVRDAVGNHWYISTPLGTWAEVKPPRELTPSLYVHRTTERGAPELLDFLQAAFGARLEARHDAPDGLVMHAVLQIGDGAIEIGEGREPAFTAPAAFYLYVDDCDALYARAVAAGATALHPPADQAFGDRMGGVADPWGNEWFIATHLGATP